VKFGTLIGETCRPCGAKQLIFTLLSKNNAGMAALRGNLPVKNLRSFITKAHCSMTHLKQQKSFGWAMDVIYDFYYIHGPMDVLEETK